MIARQRPETANGITFMLIEDERGVVNLIVGAAVYERSRVVVRSAPLVRARGRLERREGTINVVVVAIEALQPRAHPGENSSAHDRNVLRRQAVTALRAVAPAPHSFGRRRG